MACRAVVGGSSCGFALPDLAIASRASLALAPVGRAGRSPVTCADRLPILSPSPAPAAPTKRTLGGSRVSSPPPWSPCSSPRSRSVRHGPRCGSSCPEAPPVRRSRHSPLHRKVESLDLFVGQVVPIVALPQKLFAIAQHP